MTRTSWWRRATRLACALSLALGALTACSSPPPGVAAPKGDRAALEKLADAYRSVAEQLPISPANQPPSDKRRFVEFVFVTAGYDYNATLKSLATELDPGNPLHRDLVELVLLPLTGLPDEEIAELYSADEVAAISQIKAAL